MASSAIYGEAKSMGVNIISSKKYSERRRLRKLAKAVGAVRRAVYALPAHHRRAVLFELGIECGLIPPQENAGEEVG